jgi:hypothetical protein
VIRCIACRMSWHQADALDRYLAHTCHPIAAAPSPQVAQQAASFLAHPSHGERVEAGETAVPGAPTGDGGGAFSGVSSPGAAPLFHWIGERNARPLRWALHPMERES